MAVVDCRVMTGVRGRKRDKPGDVEFPHFHGLAWRIKRRRWWKGRRGFVPSNLLGWILILCIRWCLSGWRGVREFARIR
jgi:hypothetical protein